MKKMIKYIILFISLSVYGQDKELFDYINTYRVANHVKSLEWSDKLTEERSVVHIDNLVRKEKETEDTTFLFHNPDGGLENIVFIGGLCSRKNSIKGFNVFLNKYYNFGSYDPYNLDTNMLERFIKLNMIYLWSTSPGHNKTMLMESHRYMGSDTSIKDFRFQDNKFFGVVTKSSELFDTNYQGVAFGVSNFE